MDSKLKILIVEDNEATRNNYIEQFQFFDNLELLGATGSTRIGIEKISENCPHSIILDLELHEGYGNGLSFLKELRQMELEKQPYVLVVTNNISNITHDLVRKAGADFVMTKVQEDYSATMVLEFLSSISDSLVPQSRKSSAAESKQQAKLYAVIEKELDLIGISPKMKGRAYLTEAIAIAYNKGHRNVSRALADKFGKTDSSIERAMQTAINRAWRITDIESLEVHYTAYINPMKGVPTLTEFICYYAEKIRKIL